MITAGRQPAAARGGRLPDAPDDARTANRLAQTAREVAKWDAHYEAKLDAFSQAPDEGERTAQTFSWDFIWRRDALDLISRLTTLAVPTGRTAHVLEFACGSARTSLALAATRSDVEVILLDASTGALRFARHNARHCAGAVHLVRGDMFAPPLRPRSCDVVWNVGTLEHYDDDSISAVCECMRQLVSPGGFVCFGIPNRYNVQVLRAAFAGSSIGHRLLPKYSGYRFDSERLLGVRRFLHLLSRRTGLSFSVHRAGSAALDSAGAPVQKLCDRFLRHSFLSFITLFVARVT